MICFRRVSNLNKTLIPNLLGLSSSSSSSSSTKFSFDINKFNDIHVKSNNVLKFSQETNFDPSVFETTLKSKIFNKITPL